METGIKRRIAIGAAGLTILGGGGGAYALADRGNDDERQAFLNNAAKRLDVSPTQLRSALKGAMDDRLQADVKKGRLTQKQADAIKQHRGQPGRPPRGAHRGGPPGMEGAQAAAKYLGLSDSELRKKLQSGKSLAQVAKDEDKSVDDLKSAIKDALQAKLDDRVDEMVNRSGPPGPPGGPGGPGHLRGGPPPVGPGGPPPGF
jgi:transposase-like protein